MTPAPDAIHARTWDEFVGQGPMKEELDFRIRAALAQHQPVGHVFLSGPPGFGKTTIARIIARQMGTDLLEFDTPPKLGQLVAAIRRNRQKCGVLFLDELHRYSTSEQEQFLTLVGADPWSGFIRDGMGQKVPVCMTVIGATTVENKVILPLQERFQIVPEIVDYTDEEMGQIVRGMVRRLKIRDADGTRIGLTDSACLALGRATGGVPRRAEPIATAIRDMAALDEQITLGGVLKRANVEPNGLDRTQLRYLELLAFCGGRAGLEKLARGLRKHPTTIAEKEWLLLKQGLIEFGASSGRVLTENGYTRLDEFAAFEAAQEEA
jgi:Holliday junction DNA helicase RuvB